VTIEAFPTRVRVYPSPLGGHLRVPGDKSLSHRALLIGALVGRPVTVRGLALSGDVRSTAAGLRTLGGRVQLDADPAGLAGTITGPLGEAEDVVDCGNSGTSLRLLSGIAAGIEGLTVLTGDASLRRRPVDRIREPLSAMGARVDARAAGRLPPLVVRGGGLVGITYRSPVASAQVKSAVLIAGLAASGPTSVEAPLPSRDHTERLLRYLGGDVETQVGNDGSERTTLRPGGLSARDIDVCGDPSSAAFWWVAAALSPEREGVTVTGVNLNPGRVGVLDVLEELGADVERAGKSDQAGEPVGDVTVRYAPLGTARVAGRTVVDAIDELSLLALAGALADDGLTVSDAAELRVKESDRIEATARALGGLGIHVRTAADGFHVPGRQRPTGGTVEARGDHRIAMLGAVAGTIASGPVEIVGFDAVATSYPTFLDDFATLGGDVEVLEALGTARG